MQRYLVVRSFLFVLVLGLWASVSPLKAHADTVSLTFENVGPGNNSGGVYTYPYNFSIDGSSNYVPLMCYSYNDEIYTGESWTATVESISTNAEKELAYLYSVASNPTSLASTVSAAQWAAWELFDPSLSSAPNQSAVTSELNQAATFITTADPSFYTQYSLFVPVSGSQIPNSDGTPQSFIGTAVTPEPSSLILFGSGLLFLALVLRRKKLVPNQVAC